MNEDTAVEHPLPLAAVGHLGRDCLQGDGPETVSLGGSLMHFLTGIAFAHQPTTAYTWTEAILAAEADRRLPAWIAIDNVAVAAAPRFTIEYDGELLTRFDIDNIDMPDAVATRVPPERDVHFTAMPLPDIRTLLLRWRPARWSMQLHEAVLPEDLDLDETIPAPDVVFCNDSEWAQIERRGTFAHPSTSWVVTKRDEIRVQRGIQQTWSYRFDALGTVVESTGAGDVLTGATLGALRRGMPLDGAVRFGAGVAVLSLFDRSSEGLAAWWS